MAIAPDTAIAIRKAPEGAEGGTPTLRIANVDPGRYPAATFPADPAQAVDTAHHSWANYFVCAYKGVFEWAASAGLDVEPAGLEVMVHGTVPLGELNENFWCFLLFCFLLERSGDERGER
jgi:N-acetylgalactosamine kinase